MSQPKDRYESIFEAAEWVMGEATHDAELFFAEFKEELDPAKTDWDGTAWGDVLSEARRRYPQLTPDHMDHLWELYQATLVVSTRSQARQAIAIRDLLAQRREAPSQHTTRRDR
jgi:molybdopterin converting factor small subunit